MMQQFEAITDSPLAGDSLSEMSVLQDAYTSSTRRGVRLPDKITTPGVGSVLCQGNCSGNGECRDGSCYCMIRYDGDDCRHINFSYHVAFASIFFLLALTSLIQLAMCIHAEYLRMKKNPSLLRACRITTQKFLYFAVFLAALLRGTYFAAPTVGSEWSTSLLSAYYPVVLTSASLIVCFWAEVFHLREVRWDRPRFLSKSFLGFAAFNVISYSLLIAELLMVWLPSASDKGTSEEIVKSREDDRREFYAHIFNACYAVLMFVVVIFFLIYGVEVFFKVRGGFTVTRVPNVIGSSRMATIDGAVVFLDPEEVQRRRILRKLQRRREKSQNVVPGMSNVAQANIEVNEQGINNKDYSEDSPLNNHNPILLQNDEEDRMNNLSKNNKSNHNCQIETNETFEDPEARKCLLTNSSQLNQGEATVLPRYPNNTIKHVPPRNSGKNMNGVRSSIMASNHLKVNSISENIEEEDDSIDQCRKSEIGQCPTNLDAKFRRTMYGNDDIFDQLVNTSQLHQSRLGLLSQALMMIITVGFLFSETLEEFWKTKVNLTSRNTHDIVFRTIEIGVALWFPCVLWNCIRPEQLWCLNPKKILDRGRTFKLQFNGGAKGNRESFGGRQKSDLNNISKTDQIGRDSRETSTDFSTTDDDEERPPECWICYDPDRIDAGPMINPCECRGDVSAVHHDCLRRWLVESADNSDALKCKVCDGTYMVEKGSQFSLSKGFTAKQWLQTASLVTIMCLSVGGSWAIIQLYAQPWIRTLAVGVALFVLYFCMRSLGLNTVSAYQRAKVSALKIVNLGMRRTNANRKESEQTITSTQLTNGESSATSHQQNGNGKHSRKILEQNSFPSNIGQTRLSMDQIEPIQPSSIIKNTQKSRI